MLTSWKHSRTSIEYTPPPNNKRIEKSANYPVSPDVIIGAQLVQPFFDPNYQERTNTSLPSRGNEKRRKFNEDNAAAGVISLGKDVEPVLCLTSPHRVVFMGTGENTSSSTDGSLVESKSRNYVTPPGPSSRFSLCNTGQYTTNRTTFAGMVSPGAQYDPASNLIYAIRNGGTEVAIWTAASSSTLPGPDDKGSEEVSTGRKHDLAGEKEEVHNTMMMSKKSRKRQAMQQQQDSNLEIGSSKVAIISQRLKIPKGSFAKTLSPFTIPESSLLKGHGKLAVVGAAGCCEDGSVWVAVCFPPNGQFQLLIVEGSSMDTSTSVENANEHRKLSAKVHMEDRKSGWVLLDSCVTGKFSHCVTSGAINHRPSVILSIQSVMLSEDTKSQVVFRSQEVRIHIKESNDRQPSVRLEKLMKQDILQLDSSVSDVAVKLDMNTDSLSIIHRKTGDRWMFTLIKISQADGALVNLTRTFPLPCDETSNAATLFSFGRVGLSCVAVLLKSQSTKKKDNSVLSLSLIDFQRTAKLSSLRWTEGDDVENEETSIMTEVLQGKKCHAMITNDLDGSIALLMSSKESEGFLDIVLSKVEMNLMKTSNESMTPRSTSLAFALNSKASLVSNPIEPINSKVQKARSNSNLAKVFCNEADNINAGQNVVDNAVDKACKLLATSSKDLIDLIVGSSDTENGLVRNGTSLKVSKTSKRIISWREVYQKGSMLILEAKEEHLNRNSLMRDSFKADGNTFVELKSIMTVEMPKRFVEVAFKETATILLLLQKESAPTQVHKEFQNSIQEATSILVEVLQTNLITAREDYAVGFLHHGHVLLLILQACPTISLSDTGVGIVGKLHVIDAMLEHVRDIPEGVLVSFLRFVLINVKVEDAVAFYSTTPVTSEKGTSLSNQYKELSSASGHDVRKHIGTRLLSEALLDFTSRIVTYSYCNHFFLTKAMLDNITTSGEVETILLTFAKLLKLGSTCNVWKGNNESKKSHPNQASLSLGTIRWISALTDAHTDTILKTMNEGGLVIDRVKSAVHDAMVQSEFANEIRESSDLIMSGEEANVIMKTSTAQSRSCETVIAAYSIERLVF